MINAHDAEATSRGSPRSSVANLDTTAGSILHVLPGVLKRIGVGEFERVVMYVAAVALTYLPLLIGASVSPRSMTVTQGTFPLPFLYDVNVIFIFFVSFPCILILTVTDQQMLIGALNSVQADGTITIAETDRSAIANRWFRLFRIANWAAQALGLVIGSIVAYSNYEIFRDIKIGHWIVDNTRLVPVGYVYLYCLVLFYIVATVYVIRTITIALLLRDIVAHAQLHMLPLHPDKAGGLQQVGRLGLRNQYALTLLGLNIVLIMITIGGFIFFNKQVLGLIAAGIVVYVILGPIVFMAPLLSFRSGMLRNKAQLMSEVGLRLRVELDRLRARLPSGAITAEDEQLIERLRKIGTIIDELPVWPFDADTLRKFLAAYVLPVAISISSLVAIDYIRSFLKS